MTGRQLRQGFNSFEGIVGRSIHMCRSPEAQSSKGMSGGRCPPAIAAWPQWCWAAFSVLQAAMARPLPGMQIRLHTSGALSFPEVAAGPGKQFPASEKPVVLGVKSDPLILPCVRLTANLYCTLVISKMTGKKVANSWIPYS